MKKIFLAGVFALLPIVVTIYLLLFIYRLLTSGITPVVQRVGKSYGYEFPPYTSELIGLLTVVLLIVIVGFITRRFLGKQFIELFEKVMSTIPVVKTIYFGTKQIIDSFSSTTSGHAFSKVVLVEFPRRGSWAMAFVIKDSDDIINRSIGEECYNLFVPTAPNPTSGFPIIVPKKDTKDVGMSVEMGLKFVLSIGLLKVDESVSEPDNIKPADTKDV